MCLLVFQVIFLPIYGQIGDSLRISLGGSTFDAKEIVVDRKIPWDLVCSPDDDLWFTEKGGGIYRLNSITNSVDTIGIIDEVYVSPKENAGMHSMCFHPNWPDTMSLFVHYVYEMNKSKLVRFEIDSISSSIRSEKIIFDNLAAARSHNGSRMTIDASNNILFAIGDAYQFDPAQDLKSLSGKILRFTPWGAVPADNPFPDSYVWSSGHRNPQGLVFAKNGLLYSSEHGPTTDDEINIIEKGRNYGWPNVNGFCDLPSEKAFCEKNDVAEPIWAFTPTAAPSGVTHYSYDYFSEFNNHLLQCFLKGKSLCAVELSEDGKSVVGVMNYFENDYLRLRDVEVASDGSFFIATSNHEKTLPPVKEHDDKIIHVTNLEVVSKNTMFIGLDIEGHTLIARVASKEKPAIIRLTTFYGGTIIEKNIQPNSIESLEHVFYKKGVYWLKYIEDKRIVTKLVRVE